MALRRSSLGEGGRSVTFCPYLFLLINTFILLPYHLLLYPYPFILFSCCISAIWWLNFFGSVWHFVQVTLKLVWLFGEKANLKQSTSLMHTQLMREVKKLYRSQQPWPREAFVWVGRCLSIKVSCLISCGKKVIQVEGAGYKKREPKGSIN